MTIKGYIYKKCCTVLLIVFMTCLNLYAQADHPEYFPQEIYHGIDVSNHQGNIDWNQVAKDENVQFVYIKATEGATYVSPTFEQNIKEARKAGMKVGCYHFLRATSYIHDQFKNFIEYCKKEEQDLAPLIDIEIKGRWCAEEVADSVKLFADLLENHYGCRPVIYTGTNFFNKYLAGSFSEGYELFIAKYSDEEPILADGTPYTLWQFTDCGEVNGINTDVDQSRFNIGKSLNDILFNPVPRDPDVIAVTNMVKPIISMNMQKPSKIRSSRTERIRKIQEKQINDEEKIQKKRHRRSDIDDEDDYMPAPALPSTKSTQAKS